MVDIIKDDFVCGYIYGNPHEYMYSIRAPRETREKWPLLTVEIEVNGDSKSTNERGPSFLGWFVGLVVPVQAFLSCFGSSS